MRLKFFFLFVYRDKVISDTSDSKMGQLEIAVFGVNHRKIGRSNKTVRLIKETWPQSKLWKLRESACLISYIAKKLHTTQETYFKIL